MYEGLQEEDALEDLPWVMQYIGVAEDKANLKTRCELRDAAGNLISSKLVQPKLAESTKFPIHTWTNIPDDCTIAWDAQTFTCDDEAGSDRLEIEILTLDYVLLAQMSNDILADWPQADIEGLLAELESNSSNGPYEQKLWKGLEAKIDASAELGNLIMPTIYSDVVQTGDDGMASGQIPIPDFWPKSEYFLNFHYGYSARSEASESAKFLQFLKEWGITLLTLIVALVIAIVFVATGGTIAIALPAVVTTAAFVADLGLLAHDFLATGFGLIDENAEGCLFPMYGFNHTYSFGFNPEEIVEDAANNINSTIPPETIELVEDWLTESDFWSKVVSLGILGGLALAAVRSVV